MILLLLAILQAAAAPETATPRVSVDLPPAWRPVGCPASTGTGTGTDIVVCAQRDAGERYRLHPLPEKYAEPDDIGIGFDLGKGARGDLHVEQGTLINGVTAKRVMMTVKIPF